MNIGSYQYSLSIELPDPLQQEAVNLDDPMTKHDPRQEAMENGAFEAPQTGARPGTTPIVSSAN